MKVRAAHFEDHPHFFAVCSRNQLSPPSEEFWDRLWQQDPFAAHFPEAPLGWLIEDGAGKAVGCLMNQRRAFERNGATITGGLAANWAVDPEARGVAIQLMVHFWRQKTRDFLFVSSASAVAAKIFPAMKALPLPMRDYGMHNIWPVRPGAFAASMLRRKVGAVAGVLGGPAGLSLQMVQTARRILRGGRGVYPVTRLNAFDARFDALWQSLRSEPGRLIGIRNRDALAWRFGLELASGSMLLLGCEAGGTLQGYALLQQREDPKNRLRRFVVVDFQAAHDDPAVLASLLSGVLDAARKEGGDVVEFIGFAEKKRAIAESFAPLHYPQPYLNFYYKPTTPGMDATMQDPAIWDASPFDRD